MTVPASEVRIAAALALACDHEPSENIDQQSSFVGGTALASLTATGEAARYNSSSASAFGLVSLGTS
ncbi:hypothetical protein E2562_027671 [Oryza meyeriana var. granulata]|uniref:Uncharacterized protein n=1 Tax=Oryza meyeriana var. granulata TaxID=110450 RepID=A0A6G1EQG3_9ORYZ|nr:hypothetical protein E2562_027671 [Oryza meyeriana var. granulata]